MKLDVDINIIRSDPPFVSLEGRTYNLDETLQLIELLTEKATELICLSSREKA